MHLLTNAPKRCYNAAFSLLIVLRRNFSFYTVLVYLCLKCIFLHPQDDVFKGLRVVCVFVHDDRRIHGGIVHLVTSSVCKMRFSLSTKE